MSTVKERAQWRDLATKAGPWLFNERYLRFDTAQHDVTWQAIGVSLPEFGEPTSLEALHALADGRFICAARDVVLALLDDVEVLIAATSEDARQIRAQYATIEQLREVLKESLDHWKGAAVGDPGPRHAELRRLVRDGE